MDGPFKYAVYADGEDGRRIAEQALAGTAEVVSEWGEFLRVIDTVRAAAVVLPHLGSPRATDVARLKGERPLLPLVLVTELNPTNARALQQLPPIEEVLFTDELRADSLGVALTRANRHSLLNRAVAVIEAQEHLSPELRATLVKACRLAKPVRSVHRLAKGIMGYSDSALRAHWRAEARPGTKVHDFIDWLLVAHACTEWRVGMKPGSLAERVGVDARTLEGASARRFARVPLSTLLSSVDVVLEDLASLLRTSSQ